MSRTNAALSRSGDTAVLIDCIPNISTEKPSMMSPTWRRCWLRLNMRRIMPHTAITALSVDVENSATQPLPSSSERQIIQPVTLVPRSAPRITAIACRSFIIPELTKPTTITDVAEDDCMTAVTPVPNSTPRSGVPDRRYSTSSSLLPATFFSPSPISVIPNRNSATPPSSEIILFRFICILIPAPAQLYTVRRNMSIGVYFILTIYPAGGKPQ